MSNRSNNNKGEIAYDDLREWLLQADRLGEVRIVRGARWEKDIGLAAEAVLRLGPLVAHPRRSAMSAITSGVGRRADYIYSLRALRLMTHNGPSHADALRQLILATADIATNAPLRPRRQHERRPQGRVRTVLSDPSRKALKSAGQLLADLPY
jgi:hypothetical protein